MPIKTTAVIKEKPPKVFYIDEFITKRTAKIPSPDKYIKTNNWCEQTGTGRPKGKFMMEPKVTFSEKILVDGKKKPTPGPLNYKKENSWEFVQPLKRSVCEVKEKVVNFTDEKVAHKEGYPIFTKYSAIEHEITKPRSPKWII